MKNDKSGIIEAMTLYPCTKNPPCANVSGHRTPVCPKNTASSVNNVSVGKLKASIVAKEESAPTKVKYRKNRDVYWERWEYGKGPNGIYFRQFHRNGILENEKWEENEEGELANGPNGLIYRSYLDNGILRNEKLGLDNGPDGLLVRTYHKNGKLAGESWEPGKGPDGLRYVSFYENKKLQEECWEEGEALNNTHIRVYDNEGRLISVEYWE